MRNLRDDSRYPDGEGSLALYRSRGRLFKASPKGREESQAGGRQISEGLRKEAEGSEEKAPKNRSFQSNEASAP